MESGKIRRDTPRTFVITGATDGIGLALARRLQGSCDRLMLVARRRRTSCVTPALRMRCTARNKRILIPGGTNRAVARLARIWPAPFELLMRRAILDKLDPGDTAAMAGR